MQNENDTCLYILARSDLPSCNAGKMIAQACHAQALLDNYHIVNEKWKSILSLWKEVSYSYGTTIVLDVSKNDINNFKNFLNIKYDNAVIENEKCLAGVVSDPTYPFIIDDEYVELLDPNIQTMQPTSLNNGKSVCYRNEITCMFIFGHKKDISLLLKRFNLFS